MANPSLQIGNSNWAIKEDNLLGYSTAGTRFLPQPITMTRASAGTRVNPQGLIETVELLGSDLIFNGDFATDTDWVKLNGSTISGGVGNVIANGAINSTGGNWSLNQVNIFAYNITYKVNFKARQTGGTGNFQVGQGYQIGFNESITSAFVEYSFYITGTSVSGNANDFIISIGGATIGDTFEIDNVSVKESTKNNLARVDYDGTASSLLVEPQRTNLVTYSSDFSQSYWTKQSGVTATYNTTETLSPDGTYNATKFIGNGSSGVLKSSISATGVVARSVYLKSVTGTVNVKLKDPNATVTTLTLDVTTEWQRFDLTEDNGTAFQGLWIDDIPVSGIYMWGAQLEEGSYATSYIPTDGSTVTRVQDQYSKTGISNLINSEEGVLFLEMAALSNDGTDRQICLRDNTWTNRMFLRLDATSNQITFRYYIGGSLTVNLIHTLTDITISNKIACKWELNKFKLYVNGDNVAEDLSANVMGADLMNRIAFDDGLGTNIFFGKVKQLQVFKTALTDSELIALTTI